MNKIGKEEIIGETIHNTRGTAMKIIAARSCSDIDVQFLDEHNFIRKGCAYVNFKKGNILNPYDKTAYGVGYLGVGKYKTVETDNPHKSTHVDRAWRNMLRRCYYEKTSDEFRTYYGICTVCEDWFDFQKFAEWYYSNEYHVDERLHIDKDILYPGNKVYSPETCLLVPQRINMLFVNKPNSRGLPNGITKVKNEYEVKYNAIKIGKYGTLKDACEAYEKQKDKTIKEIALEYINIIPSKVYEALMNYHTDMNYDKNIA